MLRMGWAPVALIPGRSMWLFGFDGWRDRKSGGKVPPPKVNPHCILSTREENCGKKILLAESEAGKLPHYSAVFRRKTGAQMLPQGLPSREKEKAKNTYPRELLPPLSVFPVLFKESKRAKRRSCFAALHKHPQIRVVPGVSLPCKVTEMSRIVFPLLPLFPPTGNCQCLFKRYPLYLARMPAGQTLMDYSLGLAACQGDKDSLPAPRPRAVPLTGEQPRNRPARCSAPLSAAGFKSRLQLIFDLTYKNN